MTRCYKWLRPCCRQIYVAFRCNDTVVYRYKQREREREGDLHRSKAGVNIRLLHYRMFPTALLGPCYFHINAQYFRSYFNLIFSIIIFSMYKCGKCRNSQLTSCLVPYLHRLYTVFRKLFINGCKTLPGDHTTQCAFDDRDQAWISRNILKSKLGQILTAKKNPPT